MDNIFSFMKNRIITHMVILKHFIFFSDDYSIFFVNIEYMYCSYYLRPNVFY